MDPTSAPPARGGLLDGLLIVSVAGTSFLGSFFSGALTSSLPAVARTLGYDTASLQWPVALYALVLGSLLLPAGRLADIYTPRLLFLVGAASFSLISLGIALAPTSVGFSALCSILGVAAALNIPSGVGILGRYFPAGQKKNLAFSALGAGQPLGFITGLIIGAVLTETKTGWRASFYVQSALGAAFTALGFVAIPKQLDVDAVPIPLADLDPDGQSTTSKVEVIDISENKKIDFVGTILSVSGLVLLTFALADASSEKRGWKTPFLPPLIPVSLLILTAFVFWERRLEKQIRSYYGSAPSERKGSPPAPPLLSPSILSAPTLPSIFGLVFFAWASFNTASYYVNLIMQLVMEKSAVTTALYFLPMIISGFILNFVPGLLMSKVSGKYIIVTAMVLSLVCPILQATMDEKASYWRFLFPLMVFAPATDLVFPVAAVQISKSVSRAEQATAGALFNVTTRLATSISLAIISSISTLISNSYLAKHPLDSSLRPNTSESPEVLMAGYRIAAWLCVGCTAVALVISVAGLRGMGVVGKKEDKEA